MNNNKLPKEINILRLAEHGASLRGFVDIADMSRLEPALVSAANQAEVELHFGVDVEGLRYIKGQIRATLSLICQRCLKPMDFLVDDTVALSPIFNENQANTLPNGYEPVMISDHETQSLTALVEDELILRLPIVALHEDASCAPKLKLSAEPVVSAKSDTDNHPFAQLAELTAQLQNKPRGKKNGRSKE